MKWFDRIASKATSRKTIAFLIATVLLVTGHIGEQVWVWIAAVMIGSTSIQGAVGTVLQRIAGPRDDA